MKFYLAVTNYQWFKNLQDLQPDDANFWQPGGSTNFRILQPGEPFLFKLKVHNVIGGVGFFLKQIFLPLNFAWELYKEKNGFETFSQFQRTILTIRNDFKDTNPQIGCIILTNPVFFNSKDWIPLPDNWSNSIVQGKSYDTNDLVDAMYWEKVQSVLNNYMPSTQIIQNKLVDEIPESPIYGNPVLAKVRIGQSSFATSVISAYNKRCSISGEKTLPVLEAAHIKPYSKAGPNFTRNGLLLRSDIHKLFDAGYITITKDYKIEISNKIREEFENGREYYRFNGNELQNLPPLNDRPNHEYVEWHNENIYKG